MAAIGLVADMIARGNNLLNAPRQQVDFKTGNADAETQLNDIEQNPHIYVLGCVMDRQISYGRAWAIPYKVGLQIGGFEFDKYRKLSLPKVRRIFSRNRLHRFNTVMAENFLKAIKRIHKNYEGDASRIWTGNPSSALVIRRFLEFDGVGIKIATMAANILVREFKVSMSNLAAIDISPDVRVTRFLSTMGCLERMQREKK